MRGPVEPGLMLPALDFALLSWFRRPKVEGTMFPAVQAQINSSILARESEKWSSIPTSCIFEEGQRGTIDSWSTSIYTLLRVGAAPSSLFGCSSPHSRITAAKLLTDFEL